MAAKRKRKTASVGRGRLVAVQITEREVLEAMAPEERAAVRGRKGELRVLAEASAIDKVAECLPRVLARRLRDMCPSEYVVTELKVSLDIEGAPFGFGIKGAAEVTFGPKK